MYYCHHLPAVALYRYASMDYIFDAPIPLFYPSVSHLKPSSSNHEATLPQLVTSPTTQALVHTKKVIASPVSLLEDAHTFPEI